jgi:hypothetical protein
MNIRERIEYHSRTNYNTKRYNTLLGTLKRPSQMNIRERIKFFEAEKKRKQADAELMKDMNSKKLKEMKKM